MRHKRTRYKLGCLTTEPRKKGPDVWVYRWRERRAGRSINRKVTLGTVKDLSKTQPQRKAAVYQQKANAASAPSDDRHLTVAGLVEHYSERELGDKSDKTMKVRKAYLSTLNNHILLRWGKFLLSEVKAVGVEEWLRSIEKANGTKAKIPEVFGAAFRHGIRHELFSTNPIAHVRQVRKRTAEPSILEPSEIVSILRELEGVEPVGTAFLIAPGMG